MNALRIDRLVVRYGPRAVVDGLSLEAPDQAVTAIVGPNGAGKTTTIEACAGLVRPTTGAIEVLGSPVRPGHAPAGIGVMLQDGGLYPTARPAELVAYVSSLYPDPLPGRELLERLSIDPGSRATVRRLSGGEQQRLKAALALVGRPRLAFLDEPTAGLDANGRMIVHDLVREVVDAGTAVVITTHLMDDVEALADVVHVVDAGRVIRSATLPDLVGSEDSVWFTGTAHAALGELGAALAPGARLEEMSPGEYCAVGASDAVSMAAIASWCAQQAPAGRILRVGRRSLADAVAHTLDEGRSRR